MLSRAILEQLGALSVKETGGGGGVSRGLFDRNMILSGRAGLDPLTPAYQEAAGAINLGEISAYPETFGSLTDQADASAIVVAPTGDDLASKTTYLTLSAAGNYVQYSHPYLPRVIRAYSFITENGYTPATWTLQGSNNGTDWTTLHSGTAPTWGAGKEQVDEDISAGNIASYLYHRLVFDTFDATAVRLYAWQLWTHGISTQLGARVFADATDPLMIAFGNGETVEEVTLTSPLSVTIDPASAPHLPPTGASAYALLAYADYDPLTQETVLGAEPLNVDDYVKLGHIRTQLAGAGWSITESGWYDNASFRTSNFFDGDWATSAIRSATGSAYYTIIALTSFVFSGMKIKVLVTHADNSVRVEYTTDGGSNWNTCVRQYLYADNGLTFTEIFETPLVINGIRLVATRGTQQSAGFYEVELYCLDIPGIGTAGRKFGNGRVQLYDSAEEEWVEKCRVYLGTLNMGKGMDGEWAVNGFVPFNMPPQNLVPFPKATFPARW